MDTERHNTSPREMARAVHNHRDRPIIWFAGEACDDFNGYTNGASASGFRAAQEVMDYSAAGGIKANRYFIFLFIAISLFVGKQKL